MKNNKESRTTGADVYSTMKVFQSMGVRFRSASLVYDMEDQVRKAIMLDLAIQSAANLTMKNIKRYAPQLRATGESAFEHFETNKQKLIDSKEIYKLN